jgi:hypothetical protein
VQFVERLEQLSGVCPIAPSGPWGARRGAVGEILRPPLFGLLQITTMTDNKHDPKLVGGRHTVRELILEESPFNERYCTLQARPGESVERPIQPKQEL